MVSDVLNQPNTIKEENAQVEKRKVIDFKMVTFTLAGKDYGIDIMKVKEISKIGRFTYVPNTAPYVKGVYNLRGDIISVVDLRTFFNLETDPDRELDGKQVNMIILRLNDRSLAAIVDSIDKVVGISSESIQPPHPLFGDINIKYISGIVENNDHLYILLDVDKIFQVETGDASSSVPNRLEHSSLPSAAGAPLPVAKDKAKESVSVKTKVPETDLHIGFLEETLSTFKKFYVTPLNREWVIQRFNQWKKDHDKESWQLKNDQDAEAFLSGFYSPGTGQLWSEEYLNTIRDFLPLEKKGSLNVWNPGCGNGFESYSLAILLKKKYPDSLVKIRANDNDLISISMAPGLMFDKESVPAVYHEYMTDSNKGSQFRKEIKDYLIFEYHDVSHDNTLPVLDLIWARDVVSFLSPENQEGFLKSVEENLKPGGVLVLGLNERLFETKGWEFIEKSGVIAYKKK